jgi:hypothetical protein
MTIDRISGVCLFFLGLFVIYERRVLPLGTHSHPGPGYFPLLLAFLLVILGGLLAVRRGSSVKLRSLKWSEAKHAAAILGCCIFAALGMERIGYRITVLLMLGFLFGVMERLRLWQVVALTALLSFGSFWVFNDLLRVPLPRGGFGF